MNISGKNNKRLSILRYIIIFVLENERFYETYIYLCTYLFKKSEIYLVNTYDYKIWKKT